MKTAAVGGDDEEVKAFEPVLFRVSDRMVGGGVAFSKAGAGKQISISKLQSDDAFILDTGFELSSHVRPGASVGYVQATRTGLARCARTGGAGRLAPGPHVPVRTGHASPPRAYRAYRVSWHPRLRDLHLGRPRRVAE